MFIISVILLGSPQENLLYLYMYVCISLYMCVCAYVCVYK